MDDLYRIPSSQTYNGGKYLDTRLILKDIEIDSKTLTCRLDLNSPYAEKQVFGIADLGPIIPQLCHGYRCHIHNRAKDDLPYATLSGYSFEFSDQITSLQNIPIKLLCVRHEKKVQTPFHYIEWVLSLDNGKWVGDICGEEISINAP